MRTLQHHTGKKNQCGAALMVMLVIMVMGIAAALLGSLSTTAIKNSRQETADAALAQARDALIGYAATYLDSHPGNVFGYLPCPDVDNDGTADTIQSSAQCAGKNIPVVGRLPWKTLGLPPLRDGHGECLWYAVSGTFKAVAGGNLTDFMNWDTLGQFTVNDAGGATIAGTAEHGRPAAVIFSAGQPLGTQSHPASSGQECSGDASNSIAAYLDGGNAFTAPPSPPATPIAIILGSPGNAGNNDALLWITPGEIFSRVEKRSDFGALVTALTNDAVTCLSTLPAPITINFDTLAETAGFTVGSLDTGRIAYTSCTSDLVRQWRDNLLYAKCTTVSGPGCITLNGTTTCSGIVIFSGGRNTLHRASDLQKNDWNNYLEDTVLAAFSAGDVAFSGNTTYSPVLTSTDILACIA